MSFMLLGILNAQAAGGGGAAYDLLETTTLASSASSVTFSGLGSYSDYAHLQIRYVVRGAEASSSKDHFINLNGDTGSNYSYHTLRVNLPNVVSQGYGNQSNYFIGAVAADDVGTGIFSPGIVDVLDFASSSKNTTLKTLGGNVSSNNTVYLSSGGYFSTNAITSIAFSLNSGDYLTGTRFSLYGIKGA